MCACVCVRVCVRVYVCVCVLPVGVMCERESVRLTMEQTESIDNVISKPASNHADLPRLGVIT